jgi:hypothetical protein
MQAEMNVAAGNGGMHARGILITRTQLGGAVACKRTFCKRRDSIPAAIMELTIDNGGLIGKRTCQNKNCCH